MREVEREGRGGGGGGREGQLHRGFKLINLLKLHRHDINLPLAEEGFLASNCPYIYEIYKYFSSRASVIALRFLRRMPLTAYGLHNDADLHAAGEGIRRFQIPIVNPSRSGLLLMLKHESMVPVVVDRGFGWVFVCF